MAVLIENLQNELHVNDETIKLLEKAVEVSFETENFTIPCEICILLVNDEKIKEINLEHRNIDKATDVLSFPMVDMTEGKIKTDKGDYDLDENVLLLGDIVLSLETALKQSEEYGHSFQREVAFLATHGVFHLLGYDHMEESQESRMLQRQEAVLMQMGLTR